MLAKLFELRDAGSKGKGLFAKEMILKGTVVYFECTQCRRISKYDFESIMTKVKKSYILKYAYRKTDGSYLLPCDEIIYLNHSCNANILDSGKGFDIVVKNIARGEEATYDYRIFHHSDEFDFECMCGEVNCCRVVRSIDDHPQAQANELKKFWKKRVDAALGSISKIEQQPLKDRLPILESFK
ncbi:MAG: hypothetical protein M3115_03830 [Thermoproteota archaeon]|nr:hypothetical protein [Thermoproteota archaeon]